VPFRAALMQATTSLAVSSATPSVACSNVTRIASRIYFSISFLASSLLFAASRSAI
jgi:hypothetical protein